MLFVYPNTGRHRHWMYMCIVPLDIIWVDSDKHVVEIVRGARPCSAKPCRSYGQNCISRYVLELAAGQAERSDLRTDDHLEFSVDAMRSDGSLEDAVPDVRGCDCHRFEVALQLPAPIAAHTSRYHNDCQLTPAARLERLRVCSRLDGSVLLRLP
jgi:hypothetical protein